MENSLRQTRLQRWSKILAETKNSGRPQQHNKSNTLNNQHGINKRRRNSQPFAINLENTHTPNQQIIEPKFLMKQLL